MTIARGGSARDAPTRRVGGRAGSPMEAASSTACQTDVRSRTARVGSGVTDSNGERHPSRVRPCVRWMRGMRDVEFQRPAVAVDRVGGLRCGRGPTCSDHAKVVIATTLYVEAGYHAMGMNGTEVAVTLTPSPRRVSRRGRRRPRRAGSFPSPSGHHVPRRRSRRRGHAACARRSGSVGPRLWCATRDEQRR